NLTPVKNTGKVPQNSPSNLPSNSPSKPSQSTTQGIENSNLCSSSYVSVESKANSEFTRPSSKATDFQQSEPSNSEAIRTTDQQRDSASEPQPVETTTTEMQLDLPPNSQRSK